MFTIKFYSYFEDDVTVESVLCAPHYKVYTHSPNKKTVTIYKDLSEVDGVSFVVASALGVDDVDSVEYYDVCYVSNSTGKTVDKISTK